MQRRRLRSVAAILLTVCAQAELSVDASGVVRATLRKGESMTANSACVVGCSGRASSAKLLRSTPLVALGRKKRWWQRGLLRKKDSPFAAYSTRADEAVIMVSSSRVGHAACVVDASNSTVVLAERSVLCATPGTELEASGKSGLVTVKRGAVAVQGPGRVVSHVVPKGGRFEAKSQRVVAWTLQSEAAHDAKDWRAFAGPAVVYLASAAPPAPLGRLLRMRASPSKGGLKSVVKGSLRKAALSLVAALLLLLGSLVARPEKSVGDLPGEVLALYRGSRAAAAAITAGATAASRAAGAARRELQGDPSNET